MADLTAMARLFVAMAEDTAGRHCMLQPGRPLYREQRGPLGERFMVRQMAARRPV